MNRPFSCARALLVSLAFVLACALASAAATEKILYSFNPSGHGYQPNGGLIADSAGNLYGVTAWGGNDGLGTIYEFTRNSQGAWTEKILYSFKGGSNLYSPNGTLTFDAAGNLYGAASAGGPSLSGGIFKLTPTSTGQWNETVLYVFPASRKNGYSPNGGLVFDQAGNLYGTTTSQQGGTSVFKLAPGARGHWTINILHRFASGLAPSGNLIIDGSGNIYGTENGYVFNTSYGAVYKLTPSSGGTWIATVLYAFTGGADGAWPFGGVISDPTGDLYGTTFAGGNGCFSGCGTVFKLAPSTKGPWTETVLYNFQGLNDGGGPKGTLVFDQTGNLFGTTGYGGNNNYDNGTVFQLIPGSNGQRTERVLWSFTAGADGGTPQSGLVLGPQGEVYAATALKGTFNHGTVDELTPNSTGQWNETTLTSFAPTDGGNPKTSLIADAAGNFYGTTSTGGAYNNGTVFKLAKSGGDSWAETILYSFDIPDAFGVTANPSALIFDASGKLYGETAYGGPHNFGTVFELSPTSQGWTAKTIYAFKGKESLRPEGGLIFDPGGNLYGTTQGGGNPGCGFGCGTVFELSPGSGGVWTENVLHNFTGGSDGAAPVAGLIFDTTGNLYGTTQAGGQLDNGTVFELSPGSSGWSETIIYRFTGTHGDGKFPMAALVFDPVGNLYGTTNQGGGFIMLDCTNICGTVFKLSPGSSGGWAETILLAFTGSDGNYPLSTLILDPAGNLYGTTQYGFSNVWGTVFELSPASGGSWNETVLHTFPFPQPGARDGYGPLSGVIRNSQGHLFGTTIGGGSGGTVFEIIP